MAVTGFGARTGPAIWSPRVIVSVTSSLLIREVNENDAEENQVIPDLGLGHKMLYYFPFNLYDFYDFLTKHRHMIITVRSFDNGRCEAFASAIYGRWDIISIRFGEYGWNWVQYDVMAWLDWQQMFLNSLPIRSGSRLVRCVAMRWWRWWLRWCPNGLAVPTLPLPAWHGTRHIYSIRIWLSLVNIIMTRSL